MNRCFLAELGLCINRQLVFGQYSVLDIHNGSDGAAFSFDGAEDLLVGFSRKFRMLVGLEE